MSKNLNKIFLNSQDIISRSDVYSYKRRNQQYREVDLINDEICVNILKNIKQEDRNSFLKMDGKMIRGYKKDGLIIILFQRVKELQDELENLVKFVSKTTLNNAPLKKLPEIPKIIKRKPSMHMKAGSFERVNEISKDVRDLKFRIGLLEKDMQEIFNHFKDLDHKKRKIREIEEEPDIIIEKF